MPSGVVYHWLILLPWYDPAGRSCQVGDESASMAAAIPWHWRSILMIIFGHILIVGVAVIGKWRHRTII